LHIEAGKAEEVIDIPFQRDSYISPMIYAFKNHKQTSSLSTDQSNSSLGPQSRFKELLNNLKKLFENREQR
jgi:CRISPR/Cas system CMR subunit Cmr4 (Cas7 group RAMP superfamily)